MESEKEWPCEHINKITKDGSGPWFMYWKNRYNCRDVDIEDWVACPICGAKRPEKPKVTCKTCGQEVVIDPAKCSSKPKTLAEKLSDTLEEHDQKYPSSGDWKSGIVIALAEVAREHFSGEIQHLIDTYDHNSVFAEQLLAKLAEDSNT